MELRHRFSTRTGQTSTSTRQEFILLSDVLGVSMLVDAVNHREREGATQTTVLGPFYVGEHKPMPHGTDISAGIGGEPMFVRSRVTNLEGKPLANVEVDVWHADDDGFYDLQKPSYETQGQSLGARFSLITTAGFRSGPSCRAATDPDRRTGRRVDRGDQTSSDAARACAFPGQCARL